MSDLENLTHMPNMKWNESAKTVDTRKTILKRFLIEIETRSKKRAEMLSL